VNPIFLDTVGLLALWDADDQWHDLAEAAYAELLGRKSTFITTTFILLECGNSAARRSFRSDVVDLWRLLEAREELIRPTEEDWYQGWHAFQQSDARGAGIVDCISFAVMQRLGIEQAFTCDRHFSAAGFQTLF
jgi:predicted nucleic acid-binding protein